MFDIEKEYDQWLENGDPATKEVRDSYDALYNAFNSYVDELMTFFWKQGYKWAMKQQEAKQQEVVEKIANVHKTTKDRKRSELPPFLEWCANTGTGRRKLIDTITRERMNKIVIALPGKKLRTRNRTAGALTKQTNKV